MPKDPEIKPIETHWMGYRFRSRLEARWAVFFHSLGIRFEYELEGFKLPSGWYLPDFWLPQVSRWAEVKPGPFSERERRLCIELSESTGHACLMLTGPPDFIEYAASEKMDGKYHDISYSLTTQYLDAERRFFCMGYPEGDTSPNYWGHDYLSAVYAARGARFEHGEKP